MSLRPGEIFAGYTIERELGSGGMGTVYMAHHPRLPRFDALKLLRAELCADPGFVGRFEREADMVAQLDHPNIVEVQDRGSQAGQLWISMRFIDGTNADKALTDYLNGMPPQRAVRIVGKVASALDYAHRHQLLHRDVKPANILLTNGSDDEEDAERVLLTDFGVAKAIGEAAERISSLTSTGSVVATLDYASPEQIKGQDLDPRTDIYALGCVLYKLLTGRVPFPGDSVAARVYGHLNNVAAPPSSLDPTLPTGFDQVVASALAKEPDARYQTGRELAQAARAALASPAAASVGPAGRPSGVRSYPDGTTTGIPGGWSGYQQRTPYPAPAMARRPITPSGTRPEQFGSEFAPGRFPQAPAQPTGPPPDQPAGPPPAQPTGFAPARPAAARPGADSGVRNRRTVVIWSVVAAVLLIVLIAVALLVLRTNAAAPAPRAGGPAGQSNSMMVAFACPPPSHIACSP